MSFGDIVRQSRRRYGRETDSNCHAMPKTLVAWKSAPDFAKRAVRKSDLLNFTPWRRAQLVCALEEPILALYYDEFGIGAVKRRNVGWFERAQRSERS